MWDTLGDVLTSGNGIAIAILAMLLVIICGRWNLVRIHTDKIAIGRDSSEKERTIMRNQIEYVEMSVNALERFIPKDDDYNTFRGKYIAERVYDEVVKWITFNHIRDDEHYIAIKQEALWNLIQTLVVKDIYRDKKFRKTIDNFTAKTIRELVAIRTEYDTKRT